MDLVPPHELLPQRIPLRAIGEDRRVLYEVFPFSGIKIIEKRNREIFIRGNVANTTACRDLLKRWVIRKAHRHLIPWLEEVSRERRIPFRKAMLRGQKSRWGNCSSRKTIIINYKLIFLPVDLVRYLFIHELCHTVHLNHSLNFWELVKEKEPHYEKWHEELRTARRFVPGWIEE